MLEGFRIIGRIENIEIIAVGRSIRILPFLSKQFGKGRWRKLKGAASIERLSPAELGSRNPTDRLLGQASENHGKDGF